MVAHTPPLNAYELQVQSCKATTVPGSPWLLKPEETLHNLLDFALCNIGGWGLLGES